MRKLIYVLLVVVMFLGSFVNVFAGGPVNRKVNKKNVTLTKISKPTSTQVGKNWSYSVKVGGKALKLNRMLVTDKANYSIKVVENDAKDDIGTKSGNLKFGTNTIKVVVKENAGRYKGKSVTWTFVIKRAKFYTVNGAGLASTKAFGDVKKGPHGTGLKLELNKFKPLPASLKRGIAGLPSSVDLSSKMPPVGDQGSLGSCTAWASGYYYKSYQEAKDWHWTPNSTSTVYSPKYIYNQVNGGNDGGAYISSVFSLLQSKGVCTWAMMPYDTDYLTQPNSSQHTNAAKYKAAGVYSLGQGTYWGGKGDVNSLKAWLASGDPVVIAIPVCEDFMYMNRTYNGVTHDDVYDNVNGYYYGNHALCVVGYGPKGFKVINSWGTGWGNKGFGWISEAMLATYGYDQWSMIDNITPTEVKWNGYSKPASNNPVGNQWNVSVKVGGKSLTYGKAISTESSSATIKIVEDDTKYDDVSIVTGTLKFGQNRFKVVVKENDGYYKNKTATWYIDIYRR